MATRARLGAGLFPLSGILAALHYRSRTGRGQYIDTSLLDADVALSVWEATEYFASGRVPQAMGSAHRMSAPYQAIGCADGFITLAAANDRLFVRLCTLLGHMEWATHPDYANDTVRPQSGDAGQPDRVGDAHRVAVALAEPPRRARHPVWTDQQLRTGVPRSASSRLRARGQNRAPDAGNAADTRRSGEDVGDTSGRRSRGTAAREYTATVLRESGCDEALVAALTNTE